MTFLVVFLFPLLAYVFVPKTSSSSDVSGKSESEKGNLEFAIHKLDRGNPLEGTHRHRHEDKEGRPLRRRQSRSRNGKQRQSLHGRNAKESGSISSTLKQPLESVNTEKEDFADDIDTPSDVRKPEIHNSDIENNNPAIKENAANNNEDVVNAEMVASAEPRVLTNDEADKVNQDPDDTEDIEQMENTEMEETTGTDRKNSASFNNDRNNSNQDVNNTNSERSNGYKTVINPMVCPKCGTKEQQKEFHVNMFKQTLLQKLGLNTAPKTGGPLPPLPFDFYLGEDFSVSDEPDEEAEKRRAVKTREVFIFGTDVTERCHNKKGAGCYSFNLTDRGLDPTEVSSIELWIYKQRDLNDHHIQTFMVSELDKSSRKINGEHMLRHKNIVKRIETRLKYGWMKIYVRRAVQRWLSKPHRNNGLAVVCKTCQRENHKTIFGFKEGMMPILVFYMRQHNNHRRRYRRDTACIEGGNNCCHKESLEINFQDIGWDYIMAPPSIRPNFCTGSCNGIQAAYYNHTRLVQTLQQSVMHNYGSQLQPCCSPVSFRQPQSLIYRDHYGVVRKVDIPDLIVDDCGCI